MGQRLWGRAFNATIGGDGERDVPQTAQDIWAWLVDLLPVAARPYAGFVVASAGVIAGVAAFAKGIFDLWDRVFPSKRVEPLTHEEVMWLLARGRITIEVADYLLKKISPAGHVPADRRDEAVEALQVMAKSGTPVDRAALIAFANSEIEQGFALLAEHVSKTAGQAMPELERLAALAYVSATNSAILAFEQAAASLGSAANAMARDFLVSVEERRRSVSAGAAPLATVKV